MITFSHGYHKLWVGLERSRHKLGLTETQMGASTSPFGFRITTVLIDRDSRRQPFTIKYRSKGKLYRRRTCGFV